MTLSGSAALAGVMGCPVSHSLSPRLHGFWLQHYGIDGAYVPLAVAPVNLASAVLSLPKLGFRGVNVTVPHKEGVITFLDTVSEVAQRIGAVNTIVVGEDRQLLGTNTDAVGFMENLKQNAPNWRSNFGPAVVLGAGGAARAVVAALLDAGVPEIRLLNRTREKAENLAKSFGRSIVVLDWDHRSICLSEAALLVNTTTLGMVNQPSLDIELDTLPDYAVVNDLVYAPLVTPLLDHAGLHGLTTVDGLGMLLHQAVPGFEAWFGVRPQVNDELRQFVLGTTA